MASADDALLAHLRALEIELQQPAIRRDAARVEQLLHADFVERGRSGKVYTRDDMLAHLRDESAPADIVSDGFALSMLQPTLARLDYASAHRAPDGSLTLHALRMSIWQATDGGWQLWFHQGTAVQGRPPVSAASTPAAEPDDDAQC